MYFTYLMCPCNYLIPQNFNSYIILRFFPQTLFANIIVEQL